MAIKVVYLKLGPECNLHCKYCHAEHTTILFNPEILPVLKRFALARVNFGGGEPLLYWDKIKQVVSALGDGIRYRIVTNGTLFTSEIVEYCNEHRIRCYISLDGSNTTRDMAWPIRWDLIRRLWFCGVSTAIYKENQDIRRTLESLNTIKERYLTVEPEIWSTFPNFVHSTSKTGKLSDKELADSYVNQMTELVKEALGLFKKGHPSLFLWMAYAKFVRKKQFVGVNCCNANFVSVLADGTVCICPYTYEKAGDIFHIDAIDWQQVQEKYSRVRCKTCELFSICGDSCCANITDDECYIMRHMHKNMVALMEKEGVTCEALEKAGCPEREKVLV